MTRFFNPLLIMLVVLPACSVVPPSHEFPTPRSASVSNAGDANGTTLQAQYQQGMALLDAGQVSEAFGVLQALQAQSDRLPGLATNLGILLYEQNDLMSARTQFETATSLDSNNAAAWNWLASTHRKLGDTRSAEQALLNALDNTPEDLATHWNLAILYDQHLHQPDDAIKHYRQYQALSASGSAIVEAWIRRLDDAIKATMTSEYSP